MNKIFNLIEDFLKQYDTATERGKIIIENRLQYETLTDKECLRNEIEAAKYEGMKQAIKTISGVIHTLRLVREMDSD